MRFRFSLPRLLTILLSLVFCCGLLTGCWDSVELDRLAFTAATGVDYKDGKWVLSYQIVVPSAISPEAAGGQGRVPVSVYSTTGKTIREAVWRSQLESSRRLYFGHTRTIIIGESALKQGISELMDVYLRNLDSRETVSVLATAGESRQILNQLIQLEIVPGEALEDMIAGESKELSILPNVTMHTLGLSLLGVAKSAVLPEVLVSGAPQVTKMDELNQTNTNSKPKLGRLEVLRNGKHMGWLSQKEALGLSFLRNEIKHSTLTFPCTDQSKEPESSFRIIQSETHLSARKEDGKFNIDVKVKAEGGLLETDCSVDFNKPNAEKEMEEQMEKGVSTMIIHSFEATKKLKTDVLGFADLIHRKFPEDWRELSSNWENEFGQIIIHPKVDIKIERTGLTLKSFKKQQTGEE